MAAGIFGGRYRRFDRDSKRLKDKLAVLKQGRMAFSRKIKENA